VSELKALYLNTLGRLEVIPESEVASFKADRFSASELLGSLNRDVVEMLLNRLSAHFYIPKNTEMEVNRVSEEGCPVQYEHAAKYGVIPLGSDSRGLKVGLANPLDLEALDDLAEIYGCPVEPVLIRADALERALEGWKAEEVGEIERYRKAFAEGAVVREAVETFGTEEDEGPIVLYVERLMEEAVQRRASDIHLEPLVNGLRIRLRIDGHLQEIESPAGGLQKAIISRIKLMAHLSIAEKRRPQDGRIRHMVEGKPVDLRVSSMRSIFGETLVLRILDRESLIRGLSELGLGGDVQRQFEEAITAPDGIFLVTGPTGSGKSTTLYAALHHMNQIDRKIITIEDPVEYPLAGINQVQVNRDLGMLFTTALRAILRQAPNVIMVGEIRDRETAEVAMNASLTGHLVYSTLHTNDAPSAVLRLIEMGVKPFLIASALRGVLAQRLVRLICRYCRQERRLKRSDWFALKTTIAAPESHFYGEGCVQCRECGYLGRTGIFELMPISAEMESLIYRQAKLSEMRKMALEEGMKPMREDGIEKVLRGETTLAEILGITVDEPA